MSSNLIGPETVNTLPVETLNALKTVRPGLDATVRQGSMKRLTRWRS